MACPLLYLRWALHYRIHRNSLLSYQLKSCWIKQSWYRSSAGFKKIYIYKAKLDFNTESLPENSTQTAADKSTRCNYKTHIDQELLFLEHLFLCFLIFSAEGSSKSLQTTSLSQVSEMGPSSCFIPPLLSAKMLCSLHSLQQHPSSS